MNDVELSIVVPVYNVEDFLQTCLNSLVNQTMETGCYEIVLVNDGSTDKSLEICNNYSSLYSNIKVVSQENAGLSAARNTGIKHSSGKFISFVDSDDFVDCEMFKKMCEIMEEFNLDIVACNFYKVNEKNEKIYIKEFEEYTYRVLDTKEALKAFCRGGLPLYAWGKVYKKELFINNKIIYPVGDNYEDILTTLNIIKKSKRVFIINDKFYDYRMRNGSITNTLNRKNVLDLFNENYKTISEIYNIDNRQIDIKDKIAFKNLRIETIANVYLLYQQLIFRSLILSETINYKDNYIFFGASQLGKIYSSFGLNKFQNLLFADNDINKKGTFFCGYKVISPDDIKKSFEGNYNLIVTSMYIYDIIKQLLDLKIINNVGDIFILKGNTEVEKAFEEGFNILLKLEDENSI